MSEEAPVSFKVSDRRLFNPDGTLRTDVEREVSSAEPEPVRPTSEPATSPQNAGTPSDQPTPPKEDPLFSDFVLELATNAMVMLGLIEHPQYGRLPPDIEGARHYIDILGMLLEKTKGNLAPAEERQLQDTVSSLRMQFVAITKRVAAQVRKDT
ncbi:DUF1844 domain-containing protein [Chloracidobacterium sp. D]|jgi:hypothetical protein|uniref:DUF1844 domain-containing protein n=1 Tax=Chloracidobacterium sp. D TaxID=2821536 RepID=UPI001B8B4E0F|nr:DUF1844 domain-containing protein [Chloracidobacterium sp. D]QUV82027.1 DUF1844 domain-containing protein [Chloracidobacterium sp. D]